MENKIMFPESSDKTSRYRFIKDFSIDTFVYLYDFKLQKKINLSKIESMLNKLTESFDNLKQTFNINLEFDFE